MVGLDVAKRCLVVARARPGMDASRLVCGNAEHLPFTDAAFARVVSLGTLEHCRDALRAVREGRRVVRRGGVLRVKSANRFTLLPEPHVGV